MRRKTLRITVALAAAAAFAVAASGLPAHASSHREAPLIAQDPAADNTDLYAFVTNDDSGQKVLNILSNFIGLEDPGGGPNYTQFSPDVRYEIHIENDATMVNGSPAFSGYPDLSFYFQFKNNYQVPGTFLTNGIGTSGVGPIQSLGDGYQNLTQSYTVTMVNDTTGQATDLSAGQTLKVPPPNAGHATPNYNVGNSGANPAKQGAMTTGSLDPYTQSAIYTLSNGIKSFAGPRTDPFFADVQGIFDLVNIHAAPGENTLAGYNVHEIALQIPVSMLTTGSVPIVGVYSAASRRAVTILPSPTTNGRTNLPIAPGAVTCTGVPPANTTTGRAPFTDCPAAPSINGRTPGTLTGSTSGDWVQVSRLGNPLFNEVFNGVGEKDRWNALSPWNDATYYQQTADCPQLAGVLNIVLKLSLPSCGYSVLDSIYVPDLLKVDLSTPPVRLESDAGYSPLGGFGGDTVASAFQGKSIGAGWPTDGRRLGDDVVTLALTAVASGPTLSPLNLVSDNVPNNGLPYNHVFPFEQTPLNGWLHHHTNP